MCMMSLVFFRSLAIVASEAESDLAVCDLVMSESSKKNSVQCIRVQADETPVDFQCSICFFENCFEHY